MAAWKCRAIGTVCERLAELALAPPVSERGLCALKAQKGVRARAIAAAWRGVEKSLNGGYQIALNQELTYSGPSRILGIGARWRRRR